jgi:hypothetical protein
MSTSDAAASQSATSLVALFNTATFPDDRMRDPHHAAQLMNAVVSSVAALLFDPGTARDAADALAASVWFLRCAAALLEGGTTLSFTAARALHMVLLAAPDAHHAVLTFDDGTLLACVVGGATFRAELLQGACVACIQALCVGPQQRLASAALAGEMSVVRVLLQCYATPAWRAAATALLQALLASPTGRARCAAARGALELHVLGGALEGRFRFALQEADAQKASPAVS